MGKEINSQTTSQSKVTRYIEIFKSISGTDLKNGTHIQNDILFQKIYKNQSITFYFIKKEP